jgi:hypothetical protein
VLELAETSTIRAFRLEAKYTAARLNALEETRHLAKDFEEAADKFALLEEEDARLAIQRAELQASVETADDAWDDVVHAFQRRLLELAGNSSDHELYRRYFADLPSHVTRLSYHAELMISKDLERSLAEETVEELRVFSARLKDKREPLENSLTERTRLEVDEARFQNRVSLAKAILNKLRRIGFANLEDVAIARGRGREWCGRFFHAPNAFLDSIERDGTGVDRSAPKAANGEAAGDSTEATPA